MKKKMIKPLILGVCLTFGMMLASCGTDETRNNSGSVNEAEKESGEEESSGDAADTQILTLEDGTEITLTPVEDDSVGIYGYYTCENVGSMWAFGGDSLGVGYLDEEDSLGSYVCSMTFYQGPEDEEGNYHFCVILENPLANTSSCWYVMNVLDDDGNTVGLVLQDPGDEENYVGLTLVDQAEAAEDVPETEE